MAFNPEKYHLPSYYKHGALMDEALTVFESGEVDPAEGIVVPCPNQGAAVALVNALHRFRTAFRAQNVKNEEGRDRYAGLVIRKVELDGDGWAVLIKDRLEMTPDFDIYNAKTGDKLKTITV